MKDREIDITAWVSILPKLVTWMIILSVNSELTDKEKELYESIMPLLYNAIYPVVSIKTKEVQ